MFDDARSKSTDSLVAPNRIAVDSLNYRRPVAFLEARLGFIFDDVTLQWCGRSSRSALGAAASPGSAASEVLP